jgi:quinol---cytochrome c reductase iron-sulfur subunit, bacillus type
VADHTETERRAGTPGGDGVFGRSAGNGGAGEQGAQLPPTKPPGYFEGETMTRRMMFTGGALAAGGIATAAILLPAIGFAIGPVFEEEDFPWQDIGPPSKFTEDDYTPVTFSMVTDVGEAGKTLAYVRKRDPNLDTKLPEEYVAISTRCAHLGCPVRWVGPAERFVCPCHGGVYNAVGEVEGGPPVRPLDRFKTRVQNGQVQIGPRYSVNSDLERFSARDPGEQLDGLWKYLYPKRFTVPSVSG